MVKHINALDISGNVPVISHIPVHCRPDRNPPPSASAINRPSPEKAPTTTTHLGHGYLPHFPHYTMPPLRIAVLECDTPLDGTRARYGSYGGVFSALLDAGAALLSQETGAAPPPMMISMFDVVTAQAYPKLEDVDAILLTGSSELRMSWAHKRTGELI